MIGDARQTNTLNTEPLAPMERFKLHYRDLSDTVRHFSTVRSTLTTFLLVVGAAALGFAKARPESGFAFPAAVLFLLLAAVVCLVFSYRTEKFILRMKILWNWSFNPTADIYPRFPNTQETAARIFREMRDDVMNWLLIVFLVSLIVAYVC